MTHFFKGPPKSKDKPNLYKTIEDKFSRIADEYDRHDIGVIAESSLTHSELSYYLIRLETKHSSEVFENNAIKTKAPGH